MAVLRATVSGALERSLDVAAVLEMRGYGTGGRRAAAPHAARSRHDLAFAAAAAALLGSRVARALGRGRCLHAYPLVSIAPLTRERSLLALALPVVALAPFADRRGIEP